MAGAVGSSRSRRSSRLKRSISTSGGSSGVPIITRLVQQDVVPWYKKPNLRLLYLIMAPTCLGVEWTSGFDASLINGLQAVPAWDEYFNHPRSAELGLISSMYSLGSMVAVPFVPHVADRFGRRRAILFGSALIIFGALLQTFAHSLITFITARFIMGLGIPFAIVGASSLVGELSYPRERPTLGSLFSSSYFIGSIAAAGTTFATYSMKSDMAWRIPSFLQIVPSTLQIIFMPFLPESPRWLIAQGRGEEALSILVKYHGEGGASRYIHLNSDTGEGPEGELGLELDDEDMMTLATGEDFARAEYAQIEQTLELEMQRPETSWGEVFETWGMRRRLLICTFLGVSSQWSGNGLTSYFLSRVLEEVGIHDDKTKNVINFSISVWSLINGTCIALLVHKLRRRTAFLTCTTCLLAVVTSWTIANAIYARTGGIRWGRAVILCIFIKSPAYNIGYNAMPYTFLVELFPFSSRARGLAIYQWWVRVASFLNQLVNPIGIAMFGWKYLISYILYIIFEVAFVYFLFPETSGRTLEELAFLYEGDPVRDTRDQLMEREIVAERDEGRISIDSEGDPLVRKRAHVNDDEQPNF